MLHENAVKLIENWMRDIVKGAYGFPKGGVIVIQPVRQGIESLAQFDFTAHVDGQEMQGLRIVLPTETLKG